MKPFDESARCPKCQYDAVESEYFDGLLEMPFPYLSATEEQISRHQESYDKMLETAPDRECIKRKCARCTYRWSESVLDLQE